MGGSVVFSDLLNARLPRACPRVARFIRGELRSGCSSPDNPIFQIRRHPWDRFRIPSLCHRNPLFSLKSKSPVTSPFRSPKSGVGAEPVPAPNSIGGETLFDTGRNRSRFRVEANRSARRQIFNSAWYRRHLLRFPEACPATSKRVYKVAKEDRAIAGSSFSPIERNIDSAQHQVGLRSGGNTACTDAYGDRQHSRMCGELIFGDLSQQLFKDGWNVHAGDDRSNHQKLLPPLRPAQSYGDDLLYDFRRSA